jgi:hypothetical protein
MLMRAIAVVTLSWGALAQFPDAREALRLGRSQDDAVYDAFTRGYALPTNDLVDSAEIITEFRRAVLIVRERARLGEFGFTERDLSVAMTPHLGLVTFIAQTRLNPLHTYVKPPAYELYMATGPATPPLNGREVKRTPVYPLGGLEGTLTGVRLEITLPRAAIEAASRPELILTDENANVIWRCPIDLGRFR